MRSWIILKWSALVPHLVNRTDDHFQFLPERISIKGVSKRRKAPRQSADATRKSEKGDIFQKFKVFQASAARVMCVSVNSREIPDPLRVDVARKRPSKTISVASRDGKRIQVFRHIYEPHVTNLITVNFSDHISTFIQIVAIVKAPDLYGGHRTVSIEAPFDLQIGVVSAVKALIQDQAGWLVFMERDGPARITNGKPNINSEHAGTTKVDVHLGFRRNFTINSGAVT
ncbi:MAG: hypothetical protein ABJO77_08820 [Nisaea sp.]|uniref:hypothetical protein n=1 Tax=Nisaea sp. TaxID=2024842 RepID=UPI003299EEFD